MPEDAPLVERNAAVGGQVGGDARTPGDAIAQIDQMRNLLLEALHVSGERIAQPLDDLEHREIDIAHALADHELAAVRREHALEVAHELRHTMAPERLAAALRSRALVLVVELAADRVMRVVDLDHEVTDGELKLVRPQPALLVARRE